MIPLSAQRTTVAPRRSRIAATLVAEWPAITKPAASARVSRCRPVVSPC